MTKADETAYHSDPYVQDILTLQQSWVEVTQQIHHLHQSYLAQLLVVLPDYLMSEGRHVCTGSRYADIFLELEDERKTALMQALHQAIQDCCRLFQDRDLVSLLPDQLDERVRSLLTQAEDQLHQCLAPFLQKSSDPVPPLVTLRQLDLEINDPTLRQLRAEMRVLAGRSGYLQRELERLQVKQRQWQAETCWDQLWQGSTVSSAPLES